MSRCDSSCKYPCARDHRTKAEKIAAMRAGATTPGERAAADAAAARHPLPPKPKPPTYTTPAHTYSSNADWSQAYYVRWNDDPLYSPPSGADAQPTGAKARAAYVDEILRNEKITREMLVEELLRRAQAKETLRTKRTMPDDTTFEKE